MLKHCRISEYKIKKILKYFTEDYTASETSELLKLNRNTVNRYFSIFRESVARWLEDIIKNNTKNSRYIGYVKRGYGQTGYLKAYKVNSKLFFYTPSKEPPTAPEEGNNLYLDKDFVTITRFLFKRLAQFKRLTTKSYFLQLNECIVRYAYSKEEILDYIWKDIRKKSKNFDKLNGDTQLSTYP